MATGPQPGDKIPFSADVFRQLKDTRNLAKQTNIELGKANKELKNLIKNKAQVPQDLITKIGGLTREKAKLDEIRKTQQEIKTTNRDVKFLRAVQNLAIVKNALSGKISITDLGNLLLLNPHAAERLAERASKFFARGGDTTASRAFGSAGAFLSRAAVPLLIADIVGHKIAEDIDKNTDIKEEIADLPNKILNSGAKAGLRQSLVRTIMEENQAPQDALRQLAEMQELTGQGGETELALKEKYAQAAINKITKVSNMSKFFESMPDSLFKDFFGDFAPAPGLSDAERKRQLQDAVFYTMNDNGRRTTRFYEEQQRLEDEARMRQENQKPTDRFWNMHQDKLENVFFQLRLNIPDKLGIPEHIGN